MIRSAYKELYHFCTKRFSYLLILSIILTPATLIDYYFETNYEQYNSSYNYLLAHLMDLVNSIIAFLVVAYLYVHWHEHKKFYFNKFLQTSLKKLYPTVSSFIWLVIFLALPWFLIEMLGALIIKISLFVSDGHSTINSIIFRASSLFSVITFAILVIFGYLALKVSFVIYFAYKAGDKIGYKSLKKTFRINFSEIVQYVITIGSYFLFYAIILFVFGYIIGAGSYELNFKYTNLFTSGESNLFFDIVASFFVTMLNIPFDVLYVAFAYNLYKKYTGKLKGWV